VASALKKQNKVDLKSWRQIAGGDLLTQTGLAAQAVSVETLDDDTPEHLAAKRHAWAAAQAQARRSSFSRLADTYVAAFLAPKLAAAADTVPLSGYLWAVLSGQAPKADVDDAVQALCRQHDVFHWWLAFPQVAAAGGFSVMLGNPPWERIKLQEEEYFATRSPLVAMAKNKAERAQRIEWLREGMLLHSVNPDLERAEGLTPPNRAEIALYASFIAARRGAEAASLYAHDSRRYPLTGVGDVNTYAMFSELFLQATAPSGRAGFIVPTGIATDDSTKAYFERLAIGGHLRSMLCLENEEFVFPSVHNAFKFAVLTLGGSASSEAATLAFFARQPEQIHDSRRRFQLTSDEFALINPNTRTCPVFRSERDAELTKKLYRTAPVLISEAVTGDDGMLQRPEVNRWGIGFQRMFDMSTDSGLFVDTPGTAGHALQLPLYEAKMIHQFDHRWSTYVDADSELANKWGTAELSWAQKANPGFTLRPRYWVDEREVLARISRVPARVARAWLALHSARDATTLDASLVDLLLALGQWAAGELFHREAGAVPAANGWTPTQAHPHIAPTELHLKARFPRLNDVLRSEGLTTKKALADFPRWATQSRDVRLADDELVALAEALRASAPPEALRTLLDLWMDCRSPRWLMGWRDICRSTDERTVIASVVPRVGVGHTMPLLFIKQPPALGAALLGNWCSLVFDYVARTKVGGTHLTYGYLKQFPVLPPDHYSEADLGFIVPRVLELTYNADDLQAWGLDLAAYDLRPAADQGQAFVWNPERRAHLRAELDAYYARLYGLTRDELRYILDPKDVMGTEYPSETFRVLKDGEMRAFGEYRTQRLVLAAWDEQANMSTASQPARAFSEQGMIRNVEEGKLAGLVTALVTERKEGSSIVEIQSAVAGLTSAGHYLGPVDGSRFDALRSSIGVVDVAPLLSRILPIVQRLTSVDVLVRSTRGAEPVFVRGHGKSPGDVIQLPEHPEAARLLWQAESRRMTLTAAPANPKATGTK